MNNKAWLRIMEAFIAVLLVASAVLFIAISNKGSDIPDVVYDRGRGILEIISNNETFRGEIINDIDLTSVNCKTVPSNNNYKFIDYIKKNLPPTWDFVVNICKPNKFSNEGVPINLVNDIYVSETIITANPESYTNPRKIRLLIWIGK